MIELGPLFNPEWRGYPTRFSAQDFILWKLWMKLHSQEYHGFYYDVRLLSPEPIPDHIEPEFQKMWAINKARKIDSIAIQDERALIIEYRELADLSTIGQILGYWSLLSPQNPFNLKLAVLLVSNLIEENVRKALWVAQIPWEIVTPED